MAYMVELKKKQPWKYVLQEFTSKLAKAITGQCTATTFGNELVSNHFLSLGAMTNKVNVLGVGSDTIVLKLLAAVSSHINTAGSADVSTQRFAKLMTILSELGLDDIADQMIKKFHEYSPNCCLPDITPKAEPATTSTPETAVTSTSGAETTAYDSAPSPSRPSLQQAREVVANKPPGLAEYPVGQRKEEEVETQPLARKTLAGTPGGSSNTKRRSKPAKKEDVKTTPRNTQPGASSGANPEVGEVVDVTAKVPHAKPRKEVEGKPGQSCCNVTLVCVVIVVCSVVVVAAAFTYTVFQLASQHTGGVHFHSRPMPPKEHTTEPPKRPQPPFKHQVIFEDTPEVTGTAIGSVKELDHALKEIGNWQALCTNLGVSISTMNALNYKTHSVPAKKTACLTAFYNHDVEDGTEVNWEAVVKAVEDYPFQNKRLAKEIAKKHLKKHDEL